MTMPEIDARGPISLALTVLDEDPVAIKAHIVTVANVSEQRFSVEGDFWFAYDAFDGFVHQLSVVGSLDGQLADLSKYFVLRVTGDGLAGKARISISAKYPNVCSDPIDWATIGYAANLDATEFVQFRDTFTNFPKWW